MKESKCKYLFIEARNIIRPVVQFEPSRSNFLYEANKTKEETLDDVFNRYNIPTEYRILIIKNDGLIIKKTYDYITNNVYDITINSDELVGTYKISEIPNIFIKSLFEEESKIKLRYEINSNLTYSNYIEVLNFFNKLKNSNYLELYFNAVIEFYDIYDELKQSNCTYNEQYKKVMSWSK